ncbi:MAG TPA: HTTM domain-containing protein [Dehalococcoidia bacterium]|nr:HTTM domain-containing protein [Dehalococcoidia bacterium]
MSRWPVDVRRFIAPLLAPWRAWCCFWFEPISTVTIGLYRALYGLCVLIFVLLFLPSVDDFFGSKAMLAPAVAHHQLWLGDLWWGREPHPSVLFWLTDPLAVRLFFVALGFAAVCLAIGLYSRWSAAAVFIGLISIGRANPLALNGADVVLRVSGFYLILAPCGAAFSVDRLRALARGRAPERPPLTPPWAQRILQLQIALVYASTVLLKLKGQAWVNGTALYYTTRLEEFHHFPVPFLAHSLLLVNLATYWTLAVETAMAFLVWIPPLRPFVLLNGLLLHLGIEYSMNIPQFSAAMLIGYVLFTDVEGWWQRMCSRWPIRLMPRARLAIDAGDPRVRRGARVLRSFDLFGQLTFEPERPSEAPAAVLRPGETRLSGDEAGRWLRRRLPALRLLAPFAPLAPQLLGVGWLGCREGRSTDEGQPAIDAEMQRAAVSPVAGDETVAGSP